MVGLSSCVDIVGDDVDFESSRRVEAWACKVLPSTARACGGPLLGKTFHRMPPPALEISLLLLLPYNHFD